MKGKRIGKISVLVCTGLLLCGIPAKAAPLTEESLDVELVQNGGLLQNANAKYPLVKFQSGGANTLSVLPDKFDLREAGGISYVTSVKFQNPWGTCWAFGDMASLESSVIMQGGGTSDSVDYSEKALVWYNGQLQKGKDDDGQKEGVEYIGGDTYVYDKGGNSSMAAAQMSSWMGTSTEEEVPYQDAAGTLVEGLLNDKPVFYYSSDGDWTLDDSHLYDDAYRLKKTESILGYGSLADSEVAEDTVMLNVLEEVNPAVKTLLMERGAVAVGYCADEASPSEVGTVSSEYFNEENNAQYNNILQPSNHQVTIVGWDDNYSAANFSIRPPGDGAWIVKNNWSDVWGEDGYFYLSYYDKTISDFTSYEADTGEAGYRSYDYNYQYDYLGNKGLLNSQVEAVLAEKLVGLDREVKFANIFQAKGNETLKAVGLNDNICIDEMAFITTEIYKLNDRSNPEKGELVASQTDEIDNLLYATISLNTPVELKEREYFSVVQSIRTESGLQGVPVEIGTSAPMEVSGYDDTSYQMNYVAKCSEGESFVWGLNGLEGDRFLEEARWCDMADEEMQEFFTMPADDEETVNTVAGNVMVKAFTVDTDTTLSFSNHVLKLLCYDGEGNLIRQTEAADISQLPALPLETETVAFALLNDNGDSFSIDIDGSTYQVGEHISREEIDNNGGAAVLSLTGQNRGLTETRTYNIQLAFAEEKMVSVKIIFKDQDGDILEDSGYELFYGETGKQSITVTAPEGYELTDSGTYTVTISRNANGELAADISEITVNVKTKGQTGGSTSSGGSGTGDKNTENQNTENQNTGSKNTENKNAVGTGDDREALVWMILLLTGGMTACITAYRLKKY